MKDRLESGKWCKVYFELLDDDNLDYQAVFMLGYLTSVYNILKDKTNNDGKEYKRLSDSFIQEKINMSSPTIKKYLTQLEEQGYIEIYKISNKKKGVRYFRLTDEYLKQYPNKDDD